jgi:hypothetical protein
MSNNLPKVVLVVYIHVHSTKYNLYIKDPKLYHAHPSAHARLCMLFLKGIAGGLAALGRGTIQLKIHQENKDSIILVIDNVI